MLNFQLLVFFFVEFTGFVCGWIFLILFGFSFLLFFIVFSVKKLNNSYGFQPIIGLGISILMFVFGALFTENIKEHFSSTHFSNYIPGSGYAIVKIAEPIKFKEKSFGTIVNVKSIGDKSTTGKSLVYFHKNDSAKSLRIGDELLIKNSFKELSDPKNPDEFNYKSYMLEKGVSHQVYLKDEDFISIECIISD